MAAGRIDPQPADPSLRPASARALLGSGLFVGVAVFLANGLNAVFQIALARLLEPAEYSLLAALFTVVLVAQVTTIAFQASVAREMARSLAAGRESEAGAVLRETVSGLAVWTVALIVLVAVAFGPVTAAFGLDGSVPMAATVATVAVALAIPVAWGALQAAHLFVALGLVQVIFAGTRLAAGLGIGFAGGGSGAVMIGVAAATALSLAVSLVPLRALWTAGREVPRLRRRLATVPNTAAAIGLTLLLALPSADLLVAKLAFASHRAGVYAAASIGARALILVPMGVVTVLFPRVATLGDPARERRYLLGGLGVVAGVVSVAIVVFFAAGKTLLEATFGSDYREAAAWLGPLAIAMALYALATVYLYHFLSLGRARFAIVLIAIQAAQLVAFAVFHGTPAELIGVQIATAAVTVVSAEGWHLVRGRPQA